jgi:membrane fusion protein, multidrug efflux system
MWAIGIGRDASVLPTCASVRDKVNLMRTSNVLRRAGGLLAGLLVVSGLAYWWSKPSAAPASAPPPSPAEVNFIELKAQDAAISMQYAGRVAGFRVVEVRAQVGGILLKREYNEGAIVKVGDVLFRIDPRPYEAAFARANAQMAQAQASLTQAEENFDRTKSLAARGVTTQKALDDATAARDQWRASLQVAKADVETAKLNLEYSIVKSPIAGPTSLAAPPEGALVQAQQTLLTTITQVDPAYVNFTTTDREMREFQEMDKLRAQPIDYDSLRIELRFGDGGKHAQLGKLDTRSRTVDPRTGTIQIRTVFPNGDNSLLPGQFVRVNIEGVTVPQAIVIPKGAVSQGAQGTFVYVIDANSAAQVRPVRLDRELADGWIVKEGLKVGERIVTDGIIRVRPGAVVKPVPLASTAQPPAVGKP